MDKLQERKILGGILGIISLFGIIESQIHFIPAIALGGVSMMIRERYGKRDVKDLENERQDWLRMIITPLVPQIKSNYILSNDLFSQNPKLLRQSELGLDLPSDSVSPTLPDLIEAELEVTRLEERASLILGTLVFIPIIFALIHLFRSVTLSFFILELFCALVVGETVIATQRQNYDLQNWDLALDYLRTGQAKSVTNPRQRLAEVNPFDRDYHNQNLGIFSIRASNNPATQFYHQIMTLLIELKPKEREELLETLIEELRILPQTQVTLAKKWDAYKNRVILISLTSTALSGLFVSLSVFSLPELASSGLEFSSTPYLLWGQWILIMVLNILVWYNWYKPPRLALYTVYFSILYFLFYAMNGLIV